MTLIELKKSIHKKFDDLNDPDFLKLINTLIHNQDKVFEIPEHMKDGIRQGADDIKHGNVFTMEHFENKYSQWLKNSLFKESFC